MTYSSHGVPAAMRDVYCNAVNTSSQRYTPLHFTDRMGGAVAGRPIAIRFIETGPSTVRIVRSKKWLSAGERDCSPPRHSLYRV